MFFGLVLLVVLCPQTLIHTAMDLLLVGQKEHADVALTLLKSAIDSGPHLLLQILTALLNKFNISREIEGGRQTPFQKLLDYAFCSFMRRSFHSTLVSAANEAIRAAAQSVATSKKSGSIQTVGSLQLGDSLEVLIGSAWLVGTIARSNALTGELQIEYSRPLRDGDGAGLTASEIIVLHKRSPRLRPLTRAAGTGEDSIADTRVTTAHNRQGSESGTKSSNTTKAVPTSIAALKEAADRLTVFVSLVIGDEPEDLPASSSAAQAQASSPYYKRAPPPTAAGTGRISRRNAHGINATEIPRCESGHICQVCSVLPSSAGFVCAYCAKLYSSDSALPMLQSDPNSRISTVSLRMESTMYKWSCASCRYDVCFSCFPSPVDPTTGHPLHLIDHLNIPNSPYSDTGLRRRTPMSVRRVSRETTAGSSATVDGRVSHATVAMSTGVERENTESSPSSSSNDAAATRFTVGLVGIEEDCYCRVRAEPSVFSREVSRINHASVVDVIDHPNSDFYQLVSTPGFVKKNLGSMGHWKRFQRDRYGSMFERDGEADLTGSAMKTASPLHASESLQTKERKDREGNQGSAHKAEKEDGEEAVGEEDGGEKEKEIDPNQIRTDRFLRVVRALIQQDTALKVQFTAFVQSDDSLITAASLFNAQKEVLQSALALFSEVRFTVFVLFFCLLLY